MNRLQLITANLVDTINKLEEEADEKNKKKENILR